VLFQKQFLHSVVLFSISASSFAQAAVVIDDASFEFGGTSTTMLASCDSLDCLELAYTPELYAADGVTVLGSGPALTFSAVDTPVLFTYSYANGVLQNEVPYFISLSETPALLGGETGDYLALYFGNGAAGETCESVTIFDSSFRVSGDTSVGLDDIDPDTGCNLQDPLTGQGRDLVYGFQVPFDTNVRVLVDPEDGYNTSVYVLTDCGSVDLSCVAAADRGPSSADESLTFAATSGQLYYIVVDGNNGNSGSFRLRTKINVAFVPEGEGAGDGEGIAEGEGVADGEGTLEGEGVADGEGVVEGVLEGEGVFEGAIDGEGIAEGEGALEGEGVAEGEGVGDGEGGLEGEGVTEGDDEPILLLGVVNPDKAFYTESMEVFIGGAFEDQAQFNTGSLGIRFTTTAGSVDPDNDQAGTITAISNTQVTAQTPVRLASGASDVYLVAQLGSDRYVSNSLPFVFLPAPAVVEAYKQLLYAFASTDTSSDGKVTFAEIQVQFPEFLQEDFDGADSNGDGFLSVPELLNLSFEAVVHSGDTNGDYLFNLSELIRIIQLYNAPGYACAGSPGDTEDGFEPRAPESGDQVCDSHAIDIDGSKGVSLSELLRGIQLFNLGNYQFCSEQQTEDGFCAQP